MVYAKQNVGYLSSSPYSRKMFSIVPKEKVANAGIVQIASYWRDCIHTLNHTVAPPKPSNGDELQSFQIIRTYRTPNILLNYTFAENEGGRDTLSLMNGTKITIFLNQMSG